ncbi:hypothetical protein [Micromonospora sp. NPDC007230]
MGLTIVLIFVVFPDRLFEFAKWLIVAGGVLFLRALIGAQKWRYRR